MRLDMSGGLDEKVPPMPAERLRSLSAFFPVHDEEDNVVPMAEAVLDVLSDREAAIDAIPPVAIRDTLHEEATLLAAS